MTYGAATYFGGGVSTVYGKVDTLIVLQSASYSYTKTILTEQSSYGTIWTRRPLVNLPVALGPDAQLQVEFDHL